MNIDGASDNVNLNLFKTACHLLVCAEGEGWPLRTVTAMRKIPGHTKNEADAGFSQLSRKYYGTKNRGDATRDVLSLSKQMECIR